MKLDKKGSIPLWVAVLAAGMVLATITNTQKIMQAFMNSKKGGRKLVQYESAGNWAQNLGAYLIANNVILCRAKSWDKWDDSLTKEQYCKWNKKHEVIGVDNIAITNPLQQQAYYNLSGEEILTGGRLSYKVDVPNNVDFNLREKIKIEFTLVKVDGSNGEVGFRKMVGEIHQAICRDNNTKKIEKTINSVELGGKRIDKSCNSSSANCCSPKPSSADYCCDVGQTFVALSSVDKDYNAVLITVTGGEGTGNVFKNTTAVRRPLGRLKISFAEEHKKDGGSENTIIRCPLKCKTGITTFGSSAGCRGSLTMKNKDDEIEKVNVKVKLFNQGPGAVYSLLLMKEFRLANVAMEEICDDDDDCRDGTTSFVGKHTNYYPVCENGVCVSRKTTSNLNQFIQNRNNNNYTKVGALLPGEEIIIHDNFSCENAVPERFANLPTWSVKTVMKNFIDLQNNRAPAHITNDPTVNLYKTFNVYSIPFMQLSYKLDLTSLSTKIKTQKECNKGLQVVCESEACGPGTWLNGACKINGNRAHISPKRIFSHEEKILTTSATAFVVYDPPN